MIFFTFDRWFHPPPSAPIGGSLWLPHMGEDFSLKEGKTIYEGEEGVFILCYALHNII